MKLGIFDSGIGGEAVALSLKQAFPEAEILTVNDREHVPYGSRCANEITHLTDRAIQPLLHASCDIIILACNSATAAAIETLRRRYPSQQFIGLEPMIKAAAAATKTGIIAVCATPATLASDRYNQLAETFAAGIRIIEPNCRDWARMIESDSLNRQLIKQTVETICMHGADVIVLGCTHYHWIKDLIIDVAAGRATILEPSDAIGRRVAELLHRPMPHA